MKDFKDTFNLGKVDNFRSLKGYAGQELAFGRLIFKFIKNVINNVYFFTFF